MENNNTLHFSWIGDEKGLKGRPESTMFLYINNEEYVSDWNYSDGFTIDVPLSEPKLKIEVKIGKKDGKKGTYFNHTFEITPNSDYSAILEGQVSSFNGLKLKLSNPNEDVEENTPSCKRNLPIAILSFCFPIYGLFTGFTSPYNRKSAFYSAAIGFLLAMIISATATEGDEVGIGFGKTMLISYKPFSLLDWVFNILIGGLASLRGLLYMFLDAIF